MRTNGLNGRRDIETRRVVDVDLGQQRDWTAINITERVLVGTSEVEKVEIYYDQKRGHRVRRTHEKTLLEYRVRHLEHPTLGTPCPDIVELHHGAAKDSR